MNRIPLPAVFSELAPKVVTNDVLPTNLTAWKHPVHRWYNFIAGYSPEFVMQCIDGAALGAGQVVLDPFSGCGTTLIASSLSNIKAIGYEAHPFFHKISSAKSQILGDSHLEKVKSRIIHGLNAQKTKAEISLDAKVFLGKLFAPEVLDSLLRVRQSIETSSLAKDDLSFLILSRMIDECSFSQTDGIYKAPTSRKKALTPTESMARVFSAIEHDIDTLINGNVGEISVYNKSSQNMCEVESNSVDMMVTSPPYLNNFDYAEMTRMHLYFWNIAGSWGEITDIVRSKLIVNTTTALKGQRDKQNEYFDSLPISISGEVADCVSQLSAIKKTKAGKKDYDLMIYPYLSQMQQVYRECYRVLRPGAVSHTIIADAAFYGVHTASPQWLAEIMKAIGFKAVTCVQMRKRGTRWVLSKREGSKQGLGEYHIQGIR